jgi:hypothetical protein
MRQLTILILTSTIINVNCTGSRDNSKQIGINYEGTYKVDYVYRKLSVDEETLEKLVMSNRNFFETYTEHIHDDDQNPKNEKFIPDLYKIIDYRECDQFQHWTVFKTRNSERFDLEPYKGIFFIITDRDQKGITNLKLAEDSHTLMITSSKDSLTSIISDDNLVTTKQFMNYCSDVIDEQNRMTCWTKVITTLNKISCDKIDKIKSDTILTITVN